MIRREEPGEVWLIHQAAHAYIAGQIADHWTDAQQLPLREELLLAAYGHDAGWAAAEQQPRINIQGKPRTFTEMDLDEHFTIWENSIQAMYAQNRYAGLLTSLHCTALYDQRFRFLGDPPGARRRIQTFIAERRAWEKALIAALTDHPRYNVAVQNGSLADNLRLLQVWDYLSLLLCMSHVHEQVVDDVPTPNVARGAINVAANGPRSMTLTPYPLDQPLTCWIDARQVLGSPFETDTKLRQALDGVPYKPLVFEIGPL
ncbi:MAG: DUF3891 family protein [Anaerolineae bacterium]|nr:DUF3891 family protein [Anaerolineae bacterium]